MVDTNLYNELKERGLLYQCTDEDALKEMLSSGKPITLYEGTDPTASSLHVGHCVPYCILRRFQKAGHKVIVLMGGATACIGDPSGKSELRKMMTKEEIEKNIERIKNTLKVFLDFDGDNPAIIVNNYDWNKDYSYIDFMREIGVHFNVSKMLASEAYSKRMEQGGLTFFEMGYMLMQAYDFVHLNEKYGCTLEYGGADQWGNIVAGTELARKLNLTGDKKRKLVGATNPLLLTPDGKKMGKTEKGAIWIDKDLISSYDFYQGIYQTPDACVKMMYALFTDIPMQEIEEMIKTDIVSAKKRLAFEITKFVRGEKDAIDAQLGSDALFGNGQNLDNVPTFIVEGSELVIDIAFSSGLVQSKSEARRLITQNGMSINGNSFTIDRTLVNDDFSEGYCLLKKGKKSFIKLVKKNETV